MTPEVYAEPSPVMYSGADLQRLNALRSSFPSWRGAEEFDYRNGWTRMGSYFADGYFTHEEMCELVHNRFGVNL
jgi:hypothetical protein